MYTPDLSISIVNRCKKIILNDVTSIGEDGWDNGITGLDMSTITGASITFDSSPTGTVVSSPIDVTAVVTGADATIGTVISVTGATAVYSGFELTGASGTFPDGLYELTYKVNAGGKEYTTTVEFWGHCNAEWGRDKLYAKYSQRIEDDAKDALLRDAYDVDRLIRSMKSAISSVNINSLTYQQSVIEKILDFHDIETAY